MTFLKNLFFVFFVVIISTSHQLDAMNWRNQCRKIEPLLTATETIMLEESRASDFQIYQLLAEVTRKNPELYLPDDVTKIIVTNACGITEKLRSDCYKKYGAWLCDPGSILTFIKNRLKEVTDHTAIVTVLKTCLNYSGKSLSEIKESNGQTVLHHFSVYQASNLNYLKILLLVAGDHAWDLITIKDIYDRTALLYESQVSVINELLSRAPSREHAWSLINTPDNQGGTLLSLTKHREDVLMNEKNNYYLELVKESIEIFESYRPKEQ